MSEKSTAVRRRLSPEARRLQIIESARLVFSRAGAGRTKMRNIAEEAGISEPILYRHFASRDELFKVAVLDPLDAIVQKLAGELDGLAAAAPVERIERSELYLRLHQVFLENVIEMIPLLAAAQFSDPVEGPKLFGGLVLPRIRARLASLMVGFTGWPDSSIEMDLAVRALLGVHFGIALETVLSGGRLKVSQVAADLTRIFSVGPVRRRRAADESRKASVPRAALSQSNAASEEGALEQGADRKRLPRATRIDAIMGVAREIFLTHGLSGARSKQIAEKAGITEAFLFRLFESKETIYQAAILEPLAEAFEGFANRVREIGKSNSGAGFMKQLNRAALPFFIENGPLCIIALFSELGEGQRYYRNTLLPHLRSIQDVISSQRELFGPEVNPETARRAIFGAHWGVSFDHQRRLYEVESEHSISVLTRLFASARTVD
jgi:AcrR family transcriptional regulator